MLFSKAGDLLLYIALHPGRTPRQMQAVLNLPPDKLYGRLQILRQGNLVRSTRVRRNGRRGQSPHRYYANLDVPFQHPCISAPTTLRKTFAAVALEHEIVESKEAPGTNCAAI